MNSKYRNKTMEEYMGATYLPLEGFSTAVRDKIKRVSRKKGKYTSNSFGLQHEKLMMDSLLDILLDDLPIYEYLRPGRPPISEKDIIYAAIELQYRSSSFRRIYSDLLKLRDEGYIEHACHYNTLSKYMNSNELSKTLQELIIKSSVLVSFLDEVAAIDSTGFGKKFLLDWKCDKNSNLIKRKDYAKLHVIGGTTTNVILAASVTDANVNDTTQFPILLRDMYRNHEIKKICGDKAYLSRKNIDLTYSFGIEPRIPLKSNSSSRNKGSRHWRKYFYFIQKNREMFREEYNLRNNSETIFSMMKRTVNKPLVTKTFRGQCNEVYSKCLCHNLRVASRISSNRHLVDN